MIDDIKKNKKPIIIGLLFIAVFVFIFTTAGNKDGNSNTATVIPTNEIEEVASTTPELSVASTTNEQTTATTTDDSIVYTGTGGGNQDLLLQSDASVDTISNSENTENTTSEENPIVTAGQNILDGMGILTDEEFEQLKPDLLALIAALEALIKDLENYINYLDAQQNT